MAVRLIAPVMDNRDKQCAYRIQIEKYNQAIRYEFYLQAIMIDYVMIEDRLRSMIYHMCFLADRNATAIWKKTRPFLLDMVRQYKAEKERRATGF